MEACFKRGVCHFNAGSYFYALESFDEGLTIKPQDPRLLYKRALTYEKLGKRKESINDAQTLIKMVPTQVQPYLLAARLFRSASLINKALEILQYGIKQVTNKNDKQKLVSVKDQLYQERSKDKYQCHFNILPPEIFLKIMGSLDQTSLLRSRLVCKTWNAFIVSTPALWTDLTIFLSFKQTDMTKAKRKLITFLSRSNNSLRRLTFTGNMEPNTEDQIFFINMIQEYLAVIRKESIQYLSFIEFANFFTHSKQQVQSFFKSFPNLREFKNGDDSSFNLESLNMLLQTCPSLDALDCCINLESPNGLNHDSTFTNENLSSVTFRGYCMSPGPVIQDQLINLNHLQSLEFHGCHPFYILRNTCNFVNLRKMVLSRIMSEYSNLEFPKSFHLPNLKYFSSETVHKDVIEKLFTNATCPNLETIKIDRTKQITSSTFSLISQKCPLVSRLSLESSTFHTEYLASALTNWNELIEFCASMTSVDDAVINALTTHCPKLKILDVDDCDDVSGSAIVSLVRDRLSNVDTKSLIFRLYLDGCQIRNDSLEWLKTCVPNVGYESMRNKNMYTVTHVGNLYSTA